MDRPLAHLLSGLDLVDISGWIYSTWYQYLQRYHLKTQQSSLNLYIPTYHIYIRRNVQLLLITFFASYNRPQKGYQPPSTLLIASLSATRPTNSIFLLLLLIMENPSAIVNQFLIDSPRFATLSTGLLPL